MGHPIAIFVEPIDPNFQCAICLDVFEDPVSLIQCGHTFCKTCLESSLVQSGRSCPECRVKVDAAARAKAGAGGDGDDDDDDDDGDPFGYIDDDVDEDGVDKDKKKKTLQDISMNTVCIPVRALQNAVGNCIVRCKNNASFGCCSSTSSSSAFAGVEKTTETNQCQDRQETAVLKTAPQVHQDATSLKQDKQDDEDIIAEPTFCNWTGKLSDLNMHTSTSCRIQTITCPILGCSHKCTRHQLQSHIGSPSCTNAAISHLVRQKTMELQTQLSTTQQKLKQSEESSQFKNQMLRKQFDEICALKFNLDALTRKSVSMVQDLSQCACAVCFSKGTTNDNGTTSSLFLCGGCQRMAFCSVECEREYAVAHKRDCEAIVRERNNKRMREMEMEGGYNDNSSTSIGEAGRDESGNENNKRTKGKEKSSS